MKPINDKRFNAIFVLIKTYCFDSFPFFLIFALIKIYDYGTESYIYGSCIPRFGINARLGTKQEEDKVEVIFRVCQ